MKKSKKITIIKAAQELFARFGFVKTTVDEIARAARMGKATLYHYFRSKEDVFKEVIEKESRILNKKVKDAIDKEETPQKKLRAFVLTRMMYLNELANIYSALKDEFLNHYAFIEKAREKDFYQEIKSVKNILNEGIEKNIFVIQDAELTSFAIISALKGLEYPWSIKVSLPDIETNVDKLLEILFRGILKR
ncbi:MAG: helix-turn-helix transcriptional regulator [Candidatus Aminicenantes bacterium]|nr:helix-turn-helix transcriptional regulator [Candidatus Aminicenantes bacterium]